MIDLHIHTVASDGSETPAQIFKQVREKGLRAFGVADHNTIGSLAETFELARSANMRFFPASEIDTLYRDKDLHLLAYGIHFQDPDCEKWMEEIKTAKLDQTRERVDKLKELGLKIEYDELLQISRGKMPTGGDYVKALSLHPEGKADPRVRNYLDGPRSNSPYMNFYLDWLKAGKPAFVPFTEMECDKVIRKAIGLGAVAVLAHPTDTPVEYVAELKSAGLSGVEVYTSYHNREKSAYWKERAGELGLFITAGSDYHGKPVKPDVRMGIECEEENEIIENLTNALARSKGIFLG
jgi:hypothetical protein